jgi:hypothetical protein
MSQVALHPELQASLYKSSVGMMIGHRLVHGPYLPEMNESYNRQYESKQKHLAKLQKHKDWGCYLILIERPYRVNALIEIESHLSDEEYWKLLSEMYMDSENIWQNLYTWIRLLQSERPGRCHFMNDEERAVLESLPEKVTVYRGCTRRNANGISYTLSREKAEWFAHRFGQTGYVKQVIVSKHEIYAYLNGRKEQEVIILGKFGRSLA